MALRKILTDEDETLWKKSRLVVDFDERLHALLDDMTETMLDADGLGLAAPQVGVLRRVVVVDTGGETVLEMVNPELIKTSGEQVGLEGCLSVPGMYGIVSRPYRVRVRYQDRHGNTRETVGEGLVARAFCHETDHLEGILFTEPATEFVDTTREDCKFPDEIIDEGEELFDEAEISAGDRGTGE
ncbi:peptide deformylase [Clostridia bacterium]|nr:peptide deformylase [Clostridia bacterium]